MANLEGARRIQVVGKWVILIGGTLAVILCFFETSNTVPRVAFAYCLSMFLLALIPGGTIWVIGWIVEGFQRPPSRE